LAAAFPAVRRQSSRADLRGLRRSNDRAESEAWCAGRTGCPIVDAAMRQLTATGWRHNRARMIAASLLDQHLLIDWHGSECWFMQQLVTSTWRPTTAAGSHRRGQGPTRRPTSTSSTPCSKAGSSIRTAPSSAAGPPNWRVFPRHPSVPLGRCRRMGRLSPTPGLAWMIRRRSSTTPSHGSGSWRPTVRPGGGWQRMLAGDTTESCGLE